MIADRMGRSADDLSVRATAGLALDLFHLVDRDRDATRTREQMLAGLLGDLPSSTLVVPVLPHPAAEPDDDAQSIMSANRL